MNSWKLNTHHKGHGRAPGKHANGFPGGNNMAPGVRAPAPAAAQHSEHTPAENLGTNAQAPADTAIVSEKS